ncbi:MAG: hypothetical protein BGO77_06230 [Caedibacter sp. 37-49]|nr:MAG: hypothetical protein BGO77_06230 [Caedibacter sp. 37-49]
MKRVLILFYIITLNLMLNHITYASHFNEDGEGRLRTSSYSSNGSLDTKELAPQHNTSYPSVISKYLEVSFSGALRGLIPLPIEHPFDFMKTRMQANLGAKSAFNMVQEIYQQDGLKGFYAGVIPNGTRLMIKHAYRWPMMLAFPNFFDKFLPEETKTEYPSLKKFLTGGTIASFETLIICPLERLQVWLMTTYRDEKTLGNFYQQNRGNLKKELYRGLNASYPKQLVTWISFLVADEKCKALAREYTGEKELSFTTLLSVSFVVGAINAVITLPFGCIKTQMQKHNPVKSNTLISVTRQIYQNSGIKGFYAGWPVKLAQFMVRSLFTVTLFEKLEKKWNNSKL